MKKTITTGSDFSGVGAFDYAIGRIAEQKGFKHQRIYACDWDKYARITYAHNHGTPEYYPQDVYDRKIPEESLDIYMTSPPCQSFSLAGKREGKNSDKGVLFFNSHEFIKKNKPRFFIFENVKGLLSDDSGRTFQEWLNYLGGKSLNGLPLLFKDENAVDYHVYYKVLNSKKHGVPQNRERIFIVGIRDDADNTFRFPKEEHLTLKLKDVLETEVDEKYILSEKMIDTMIRHKINPDQDVCESAIDASYHKGFGVRGNKGRCTVKVKSATKKGFETATENDSINFSVPNSKTRRGSVGKEVAQTLDTQCNQGVIVHDIPEMVSVRKYDVDIESLQKTLKEHKTQTIKSIAESLKIKKTTVEHWFRTDKYFAVPDAEYWIELKELLDIKTNIFDESIMTFEQREGVFEKTNRVYDEKGIAPTLTCVSADERILTEAKIRRLTPRECFRLQDFPDTFDFSVVSNSQAYKQAGNSITVRVLELILNKLKL